MKYYKDENSVIYAYEEDGSQDEFIGDKTPVTQAEVDAILNPPLTPEQEKAAAEMNKLELRNVADSAVVPLQDAVDLGIANGEEEALLIAWKKYRVLLNRVDTSTAPDIDWPVKPV